MFLTMQQNELRRLKGAMEKLSPSDWAFMRSYYQRAKDAFEARKEPAFWALCHGFWDCLNTKRSGVTTKTDEVERCRKEYIEFQNRTYKETPDHHGDEEDPSVLLEAQLKELEAASEEDWPAAAAAFWGMLNSLRQTGY